MNKGYQQKSRLSGLGTNKSQWSRFKNQYKHDDYKPPWCKEKNKYKEGDDKPYWLHNRCNHKVSPRSFPHDIVDNYLREEHNRTEKEHTLDNQKLLMTKYQNNGTSPAQQEPYGYRGREYDGHGAQYNHQHWNSPGTLDNYEEQYLQDYPSMSWPNNFLQMKKPVDPDLADLLNGISTSTAKAIQHMGNNGNISVSRKSMKILNGVNKFSLKALAEESMNQYQKCS